MQLKKQKQGDKAEDADKNGRIVDPETNRDEVADILIEEGIIKRLARISIRMMRLLMQKVKS